MMAQIMSLILLFFSSAAYAHWDIEYWQYLRWKNWEKGPFQIYTSGELRLDFDLSRYYYNRVSGNISYKARPYLHFEAHCSLINIKPHGTPTASFISIQRYELESNPFVKWDNGVTLKWRNRMEFLKRENLPHIQHVFRHRVSVAIPVHHWGKLVSLKITDEIFYDFDINKFTQNRFIPVEMTFELNREVHFTLFCMVRNFFSLGSRKWFRSFVFGTEFGF
jgi:hypothetical protein